MNDLLPHWAQDWCFRCGDSVVWFGGMCTKCKEEVMKKVEVKCPECGSKHVAIKSDPLVGGPGLNGTVHWAICNEVECQEQFHVTYNLVPAKISRINKDRWVKL